MRDLRFLSASLLVVFACRGDPSDPKRESATAPREETGSSGNAIGAVNPPASTVTPSLDAGALPDAAPASCATYDGPPIFRDELERPEGRRTFEVHVPRPVPQRPRPLLVALHPFGSHGHSFLRTTRLHDEATRRGFVVLAPDGYNRSFNAGDCCGDAKRDHVDDMGFVLAAIDQLAPRLCIDTRRVHFAGFSNGGFLAQAIACTHAERVRSIVSVGAVLGWEPCAPTVPVSMLLVHGSGDKVIPTAGGGPFETKPLATGLEHWLATNRCDKKPVATSRSPVNVVCERHACGSDTETQICDAPYAHVWMIRSHPRGDASAAKETAREVLDFIEKQDKAPLR